MGYFSPALTDTVRGIFVLFHGNAGSAWQREEYCRFLNPLGYDVLLAEYPGFGGRDGAMNEKSWITDAMEILRLVKASNSTNIPVFLCGESMGCAVASALAANSEIPISGILLITPWDSLLNVAKDKYWFLPVRWMLKDRYDNIANLADYRGPVAVMVAAQDEIIAPRLARRLYESLPGPKRRWTFPKAGHNSWPSGPQEPWWGEMMGFMHSTVNGSEPKLK